MKKYRLQGFNSIFFILWIIIWGVIWITDNAQYPVIQRIISWVILLGTLVSTTYVLCNCILPKSIARGRIFVIIAQLLGMAILQATVLEVLQHAMYYLEEQGIIPSANNLEERTTLVVGIFSFLPLTFLINLGFGGLKFYFQHTKLHEQHLKLQQAHLETQLQALKAQINPHFMFNVLNHIHILMHKNINLASSLLLKYSDILRYQLQCTNKEFVNLKDEVDFMNDYIEVEKYRWENTLDVICDWQIEKADVQIPPLLFIVFIENAFKHVFRSKSKKGYIKVLMKQFEGQIVLEIENSKFDATTNQNSVQIGLENVRKRLQLQYANKFSLNVRETAAVYRTDLLITLN